MHRLVLLGVCLFAYPVFAASFKPNVLDPSYAHDRWGTRSSGAVVEFRAYRASFDDLNDNNGDGSPDAWGVPLWVAYEIKRTDNACIETHGRPNGWFADPVMVQDGLMPTDDSYAYPRSFRAKRKDWFVRGHLAMKFHAERLGADAAWNTHTFYNAVPQRQLFNAGIWQDLEDLTAAWAQRYGAVWIVLGPIYADRSPYAYLGEGGEFPVAIPEALFKIVIKEGEGADTPDVLAFIYPQVGPGYYRGKPYDHTRYLTTVDEVEKLTGIDFLVYLPNKKEEQIESAEVRTLWEVEESDFVSACRGEGGD